MKTLNIFETNEFSNMKILNLENTKIFYMDNFYKNPHLVLDYLNSIEPPIWKEWETPSRNMIDFEDRRHQLYHEGMDIVYENLSKLCGQLPVEGPNVITNYTRFKKIPNNNYNKNYWWPHNDSGYNGIIYLNDYEEEYEGTCLYKLLNPKLMTDENRLPEHSEPWTPKEYWDIIIKISAKFNRFVMFEGSVYLHGMSIFDNRWFADKLEDANYRVNQVLFFQREL